MRRQMRETVFIGCTYPLIILVWVNICLTKTRFLKDCPGLFSVLVPIFKRLLRI
jgi:hypothetical protein